MRTSWLKISRSRVSRVTGRQVAEIAGGLHAVAGPGPLRERRRRPEEAGHDDHQRTGENPPAQGHALVRRRPEHARGPRQPDGVEHPGAPRRDQQRRDERRSTASPETGEGDDQQHPDQQRERGRRDEGAHGEARRRMTAYDAVQHEQDSPAECDREQRDQQRLGAAHDVVLGAQTCGVHVDAEVAVLRSRGDVAEVEEQRAEQGGRRDQSAADTHDLVDERVG